MENQSNAPFAYQATQISTATKEQLLLITYDIGIRSCRLAETALEGEERQQDLDLANREIIRAQDVIRELMVTLNTTKGGEMAQGLMRLYDYMYQLLVEANVKKLPENIRTVRTMLEELKDTWEGALMKLLKEYQEAHPEDEDLRSALSEIKQEPASSPAPTPAPAAPKKDLQKAPQKAGGLNLAG